MLDRLRGLGELTLHGLVSLNAPSMFQGLINQLFHQYKIDVDTIVPLVSTNKSLWSLLPAEHLEKVQRVANQVDDISWLTVDWLIDAIKKEHPALASLFLGWKKARNWLGRQIEEVKKELYD